MGKKQFNQSVKKLKKKKQRKEPVSLQDCIIEGQVIVDTLFNDGKETVLNFIKEPFKKIIKKFKKTLDKF